MQVATRRPVWSKMRYWVIGEPLASGTLKLTRAPLAPNTTAFTFVGAFGLLTTFTMIVPSTAREGSPSLSLSRKPTETVPTEPGLTDMVVPEEATSASPRYTVALSNASGLPGNGLVALEATSTLTVCPTLAVREYVGTLTRGFVVGTISTGTAASTV